MSDKVTGAFSILEPRTGAFWAFVRWVAFIMERGAEQLEKRSYVVGKRVYLLDENMEIVDESSGK